MRRSFTKFPSSPSSPFISFTSSFSTSSGRGRGRGRGRGFNFTQEYESHPPTPPPPPPPSSVSENNPPPLGFGHGTAGGGGAARGKSFPSPPNSPSSFVAKPGPGRGGGRGLGLGIGTGGPISPQPTPPEAPPSDPIRKPSGGLYDSPAASIPGRPRNSEESYLPSSILSILTGGAGRGKVPNLSPPSVGPSDKPKEENRHIRARHPHPQDRRENAAVPQAQPQQQRLSQDEAVKKAIGILSRGDNGGAVPRGGRGGGLRGGRGMQAWRGGRGRGRATREQGGRSPENPADDDYGTGLYLGDDADSEKLAKRLGPDAMNQLAEGFEDMSNRVLPSPVDDAYEDALRTNLMIECEPEYLMGDFASNPDIDEKPPMSLRDALEKMKPFIMAYENIPTQEEWEV